MYDSYLLVITNLMIDNCVNSFNIENHLVPRISCQIFKNSLIFSAYGGNMGQQQQQQQSQPVHPGQQALHQAVHQSAGGVMNQQRSPNQNRNRNFIETFCSPRQVCH